MVEKSPGFKVGILVPVSSEAHCIEERAATEDYSVSSVGWVEVKAENDYPGKKYYRARNDRIKMVS